MREQHVVLADGPRRAPAPVERRGAGQRPARRRHRGATPIARFPRWPQTHAAEIERRFPKVLRRVGGYNLDEFVDPGQPVDLARIIVGSEGTLGVVVEAKVGLVPLPQAKAVLAVEFDELLDALGATPLILRHGPSAVEVMDDFILDTRARTPALDALAPDASSRATARRCSASSSTRDHADELPPRLEALERDLRGARRARAARRALTDAGGAGASGACARPRSACRWR